MLTIVFKSGLFRFLRLKYLDSEMIIMLNKRMLSSMSKMDIQYVCISLSKKMFKQTEKDKSAVLK